MSSQHEQTFSPLSYPALSGVLVTLSTIVQHPPAAAVSSWANSEGVRWASSWAKVGKSIPWCRERTTSEARQRCYSVRDCYASPLPAHFARDVRQAV